MIIAKEIDAAKIYLKQLEEEIDYLVEMTKLGEPRRGGIYYKLGQLKLHVDNISKETKQEEPKPAPASEPKSAITVEVKPVGNAKIDVSTNIKKITPP